MTTTFNSIGLIGKYNDPEVGVRLARLGHHLAAQGLEVIVESGSRTSVDGFSAGTLEQIAARCDLAIVVGGDGTLLNAARGLSQRQVPLLGINLGRLGFLVDVSPDDMLAAVDRVLAGDYISEERLLLHATVQRGSRTLTECNAFNDVVVHKTDVARMIEFDAFINDQFVYRLRSDGVIVSTPSGSTAYAMSGGGPIMQPTLNAICLVPICPHTLSNRPTVIDGDSRIVIAVRASDAMVTWDGQIKIPLQPDDRVTIRRRAAAVRLLHPSDYRYFDILREKLHWLKGP